MKKIASVNFYSDHYYPLPLEIAIAELCSYDEINVDVKDSKTKEIQKKVRFCVTVVKFWVLGSSLEGLRGTQKQHPESADSRGDLLKI